MNSTTLPATEVGEFQAAWRVVVASTLSISFGLPTIAFYTIGLLGPAVARDFGWTQVTVQSGLAILMVGLVVLSPIAGHAADRFGIRTIAIPSQILVSACFMSFAALQPSLFQYYASWVALAVLGAGTTPAIWTRPIISLFDKRRGLALGITLLGTGLFATCMKPLTAWLIDTSGWRVAYLVVGSLPLLIGVPVSLWGFRQLAGPRRDTSTRVDTLASANGLTFKQAVRDWRFALLVIVFVPVALTLAGIVPSLENLLTQLRFTRTEVVTLASAIGVSLMSGRLVGGWLIDKYWAPAVGSGILLSAALGTALLIFKGPGFNDALIAIVLIGFAGGVEYDLVGYLVARYFGTRSYSAISGALFGVFMLGGGFGPLLYAGAYDRYGSYEVSLWATVIALVASSALLPALGPYRTFSSSRP